MKLLRLYVCVCRIYIIIASYIFFASLLFLSPLFFFRREFNWAAVKRIGGGVVVVVLVVGEEIKVV